MPDATNTEPTLPALGLQGWLLKNITNLSAVTLGGVLFVALILWNREDTKEDRQMFREELKAIRVDANDRVLVMDSGNFSYDGSSDGTYTASEGATDDPGYAHLGFQSAGFRCITGRFYGAIACSSSQSGSLDAIDTYLKALQGR